MSLLKKQWRVIAIAAAMTAAAIFTAIVVGGGCTDEPKNPVTPPPDVNDISRVDWYRFLEQVRGEMELYPDGKPVDAEVSNNLDGIELPDKTETFIGYGFNCFAGPTFAAALRSPMLQDSIYTPPENGKKYIIVDGITDMEYSSSVSSDLAETYSGLQIGAKVETGTAVPFFSGSVSMDFEKKTQIKSELKFYNSTFSWMSSKHTLDSKYNLPGDLKTIVRQDYLDKINNEKISADDILEKIGTHIITAYAAGAQARVTAIYTSYEKVDDQEVKVALEVKSSYVKAGASTTITDKQKNIMSSTTVKVNSSGGTASAFAGATMETVWDRMETWAKSLDSKGKKSMPMSWIYEFIPVWDLASSPSRSAELLAAFNAKAKYNTNVLSTYITKGAAMPTDTLMDGHTYQILNYESRLALQKDYIVWWGEWLGDGVVGYGFLAKQNTTETDQHWKAVAGRGEHAGLFQIHAAVNLRGTDYLHVEGNHDDGRKELQLRWSGPSYDDTWFKVVKNGDGTVYLINEYSCCVNKFPETRKRTKLAPCRNGVCDAFVDRYNRGYLTFIDSTDRRDYTKWELLEVPSK